MKQILKVWKQRANALKVETYAIFLAYRDPRLPWIARLFAGIVLAYALSPIDLIPDFIPVIGYLDDLLLVPLGIALAIKMIPEEVMQDAHSKAHEMAEKNLPVNKTAAMIIILIWLTLAGLFLIWMCSTMKGDDRSLSRIFTNDNNGLFVCARLLPLVGHSPGFREQYTHPG